MGRASATEDIRRLLFFLFFLVEHLAQKTTRYAPKETRIHPWTFMMSGLVITPLQPVLTSSINIPSTKDDPYDSTINADPADVVVSFQIEIVLFVC